MTKLPDPKFDAAWGEGTRLVHAGARRSAFQETSEALYLTSGFVYDSAEQAEARFKEEDEGFTYSRFENPTVDMFERRIAALDGAEAARGTASGMAAVFAALACQLKAGDHIVAARALFGSCRYIVEDLLPRYGITSTLIDGRDLNAWEQAVRPQTKLFFFETPSNPTLEIIDIAAVARIAHARGLKVVIDNVFATPVLQNALKLGADIVVYSATKHIDGQGRCLGGVILGPEKFIKEELRPFIRNTGPSMSPFNAWVMLKGLETLALRVRAATATAAALSDSLAGERGIARVIYPFRADHPDSGVARRQMKAGSTLIAFEIAGGKREVFRFMNALRLVSISNNLGDSKSLITHPATTTHYRLGPQKRAEMGIAESLVRLSVGLEDLADLQEDLVQALASARA